MSEKLTDEQLEAIAKDRDCAWPESIDAMAIELLFRRACEAERAKPTQSDANDRRLAWEIIKALHFYQADTTSTTDIEIVAVAFASIRAEGSAERAKLEGAAETMRKTCAGIAADRFYYGDDDKWVADSIHKRIAALAKPAESGATVESATVDELLHALTLGAKP